MAGHFTKSGTHTRLEVTLGGLVWASITTGWCFPSTKFVLCLSIQFYANQTQICHLILTCTILIHENNGNKKVSCQEQSNNVTVRKHIKLEVCIVSGLT